MKVYIDLIFIINFLYDFLILCSVSVLLKRNASLKKIIFGCLIGASSMCVMFLKLESIVLLLFKFITSIAMNVVTFGPKNLKDNIFYFYIITIILGGSQYLLTGNAYEINIIALAIISPIIVFLYIKSQREYKLKYTKHHDVIIIDGKETYKLTGYMDTGNTLVDPITKYPVILISKNLVIKSKKKFLVPYKVVNASSLLECVMVNKVIIDNKEVKVLLGQVDNEVFIDGVDVILNENLREIL